MGPRFLAPLADEILTTGKYLNVLVSCGKRPRCPTAGPIAYTPAAAAYAGRVRAAPAFAARALRALLLRAPACPRARLCVSAASAFSPWDRRRRCCSAATDARA